MSLPAKPMLTPAEKWDLIEKEIDTKRKNARKKKKKHKKSVIKVGKPFHSVKICDSAKATQKKTKRKVRKSIRKPLPKYHEYFGESDKLEKMQVSPRGRKKIKELRAEKTKKFADYCRKNSPRLNALANLIEKCHNDELRSAFSKWKHN